eukprot:g8589.t1
MGRKKKFIDKKESSTFHVVHRSQQDKANEGEEEASEFVLIPSGPSRDNQHQEQGGSERNGKGKGKGKGGLAAEKRDHINALGLPNDGYDYDQHLKSMGGGTFVSKSGRVQHFAESSSQGARGGGAKATIAIPEEALPSGETLDRQLEAVTISEKVMDGDMRRALAAGFADVDEEGEDWDADENMLDDDFVMQAAGVGDDEGFDFDAHVARLMEASAKETGLRQRTADDDLQTKGLSRLRRDSDADSESDSEGGGDSGSDDSAEVDDALLEGLDINGGEEGGGVGVLGEGSEERAALDSQFEATLAAYDSDEWGELDEEDDRVQGQWDLEQHDYANTCMDDFLATKEDARWTEGVVRLPPEQRASAAAPLALETAAAEPGTAGGGGEGGVTAVAAGGPRLGNLRGLGGAVAEEEEEEEAEEEDELHDMEHHNEYLRDKPAEQWDCETIVSTYSNLDNHPSVLGMGRKPKPRRPSPAAAAADGGSVGRGVGAAVRRVALSEKTGLPLGVLPERTFNHTGMVSLVAGKNAGEKRDTDETAEEKRLRKARIKQSKREKRAQKKSVKVAFTTEAKVISHALANPEAPQNRSVFSYSYIQSKSFVYQATHKTTMNFIKKVTGAGGEEQPDAAPTPTPAPAGAPDPTPAPTAGGGIGGLVGSIKNAVTGHGSSGDGDGVAQPGTTGTTGEVPPADGAQGLLGNITSSISSAAHNVTDAATSTISSAAHTVTDAASGIIGHKKDGDAAVPAAGEGAATEKEGGIGGFLHSVTDAAKEAAQAVKHEIQSDIKPALKEDGAAPADAAAATPAAPAK